MEYRDANEMKNSQSWESVLPFDDGVDDVRGIVWVVQRKNNIQAGTREIIYATHNSVLVGGGCELDSSRVFDMIYLRISEAFVP